MTFLEAAINSFWFFNFLFLMQNTQNWNFLTRIKLSWIVLKVWSIVGSFYMRKLNLQYVEVWVGVGLLLSITINHNGIQFFKLVYLILAKKCLRKNISSNQLCRLCFQKNKDCFGWSKGYNYITLVTKIIVKVIINNVRTEISQLYVITFAIWV